MTTMQSWMRNRFVSTMMGGSLAAACVFGGATEASAQNRGNYGYFQGHQGQNYAASSDSLYYRNSGYSGYRYGRPRYPVPSAYYAAPSAYYDRVYHPEYYRRSFGLGRYIRGDQDTAPNDTSGHLYY